MFKCHVVLVAILNCFAMAAATQAAARPQFTLGVKAADTAAVRESYRPIVDRLSSKLGGAVALKPYASAADLGKAAKAGEITFMFLSPTDYVELHKSAEIEAIATKKNKGNTPFCQGTLIAPTTSDIRSIADLKGKSFCFGAKGSFNKYYAALAAFKEQGFDHEKELSGVVFGSDCDGIGECIMKGEANAGVVCDYSWDGWAANPKGNLDPKKFVIIGRGPKLREEVVAVPAFVKQEVRKQILDVLIALDGNPAILKAPVKATGFVASTDKDYDDLRAVLSAVTK